MQKTTIYTAISQFVQLINDLSHESYQYSLFNDMHIRPSRELVSFGFGAVCFFMRDSQLYSLYVTLENNITTNIPDTVMVTEYKVNEKCSVHQPRYSKKVAMAHVHELDDLFTKLVSTLHIDIVNLLMVNESDMFVTYAPKNKVTFVKDDGTIYDKDLFDCNYAIVTE